MNPTMPRAPAFSFCFEPPSLKVAFSPRRTSPPHPVPVSVSPRAMQMQVLLPLLAARRRAVSNITISTPLEDSEPEDDEGPFFDLDFSSVRASSSSSSSSGSDTSDDACSLQLDDYYIISLHRSRPASPSHHDFCASQPSTKAGLSLSLLLQSHNYGMEKKTKKRTLSLSFGANNSNKAGGRPSFGFGSSGRSLRLFMADEEEGVVATDASELPERGPPPSGDVIRRYITKISMRLRKSVRTRSAAAGDTNKRGVDHLRCLRKSRSASAAVTASSPPPSRSRRDDSLVERQDGIAGAIAHCKDSFHFHRASLTERDISLLRSQSDPGKCEASS